VALLSRLVTFVEVHEGDDPASGASALSFSARHDAVLADGRRIVVLDDRGWTQSGLISSSGEPAVQHQHSAWEFVTRQQVEESARVVVGRTKPTTTTRRRRWLRAIGQRSQRPFEGRASRCTRRSSARCHTTSSSVPV